MILHLKTTGKVTVAKVCISRLDIQTTVEFRKEMTALESSRNLVMNLESVEFIDSTGLGALLSLLRKLKLNDGDLRLTGVGPQVLSIFRLVRMNRVFEIYPDVDEAVSSFSQPDYVATQASQPIDDAAPRGHDMSRSSEMVREL